MIILIRYIICKDKYTKFNYFLGFKTNRFFFFDFIFYTHIGMTTGRIRAGFLYAWTWPAGLPKKPEPALFNKRVFFCAPTHATSMPNLWPNKKKKKGLPEALNLHKPRLETHTKKKKKPKIMFINLDQKPKKKKKKPRIMFINLDQKPKNKNIGPK